MFSVFVSVALSLLGCTDTSVGRHNAAPYASITSHADGDEVYEGSTISLRGSASDADDANTDLIATWFVGGEEVCVGSPTSDGITECEVEVGLDDSEVLLEVRDIEGAADSAALALVILNLPINTAPVISAVTIGPSAVYTDDLIQSTVTASDAEDDFIGYIYEWYVDGALVTDTAINIDCATYCDRGQSVYVSVIAYDGQELGEAVVSNSITVLNSAPTTPVISIDPTAPEAGVDDLICMIDTASTDDDADTITYAISWTSDSAAWTGSTYTTYESGDTIDGADIEPGVLYECVVSASDGTATTPDVKANVTPIAPGNIIHPGGGNMILISAGTFDMGCTTAQQATGGCYTDETPFHSVTLSHDFYMGETEVTQAEYIAIMGTNPSMFSSCGTDCPVEQVSWHETAEYANALSVADGLTECFNCTSGVCTTPNSPYTCDGYRLPTEAEWEYAARSGTDYVYAGSDNEGDVSWYLSNASSTTHPVAQKLTNDWGLYDMSGNVWEWTWDWYDPSYYSSSPSSDPEGPIVPQTYRVIRGGYYDGSSNPLRVSDRVASTPSVRYGGLGLRLARTVSP